MKKAINVASQSVTFTFEGGLEAVTLNTHDVTAANQTYAMLHGFAARIGDNAAISKSADNGYVVTEAMRRDAVLELVGHYTSGSEDWNVKASARKAPLNPVFLAMAEKFNITYEEAMAKVSAQFLADVEQA
jgi:hypothetical protein